MVGFSYPVVPQGQARIRTQMSAAHTREQLDRAIAAFAKVGRAPGGDPRESAGQGQGRAGHLDAGRPGAGGRPQRRADQGPQGEHLRHRHPHLQLGRVVAEDHHGADGRSATSSWARSRSSAREVTGFQVGERVSGEGHITCGHCRNCRAGKRHLCRNTVGLGVQPTGLLRRVRRASGGQRLPGARRRSPTRSPRSSIPLGNAVHTALSFDLVGEDVLITGAGPIGVMAAAICPPRRRAARGGDRRERLPPRAGAEDGRDPGGQRAHADARRRDAEPRDDRRLRRGHGDVRQRRGVPRPALGDEPRRAGGDPRAFPPTRCRSTGTRSSSRA